MPRSTGPWITKSPRIARAYRLALISCLLPALAHWVGLSINLSHSHPAHVFLILKQRPPRVGDLAVFAWPTDAYWPAGTIMVKPVLAEGPIDLRVIDRTIWIDGKPWADAVPTGTKGQPLPVPQWSGLVPPGWMVLGTTRVWDSWDSRYYGPVPAEWLSGTAIPLF
jgi:type IV secretory pathway protease TraF